MALNLLAHDIDSQDRTEDVKIDQSVTFSTMLLPNYLLDGLTSNGFKKPSPIQLAAIPRARCGLDLIVQAKSGTGKTLVFTITALESIDVNLKRLQVIVLAPTREIAIQITDVFRTVGKFIKGLKVQTFVGGRPLPADKPLLQGCQVAVGCPGRVRHLIEQKFMDSSAVRLLVLDEADKLFDSECDYQKDINYIWNKCGESKQVIAASATYPPQLLDFTQRFMRSGQLVTPASGSTPVLLGLRQFVLVTKNHPDYNARTAFKEKELLQLLAIVPFDLCCIFHHYSSRAESMNILLRKKGFSSACLTGKQSMAERTEAMSALRSGRVRILVTTDLTARGIDSSSINLVINMGLPWSPASYLHRMGRAGRYGSQGVCISLISEGPELNKFQKLLGKIGGTSMAVHLVPKIRKFDLWNDNLDDFSRIYGIESTEDDKEEENEESDAVCVESDVINGNISENVTTNVKSENENYDFKSDFVSLKDLQAELNNFVEKAKNIENVKDKKIKRKNPAVNGPANSPVTPVKNYPLSYSQMVSGRRVEAANVSVNSVSSIETPETLSIEPNGEPKDDSVTERPSCLPRIVISEVLDESRRSKRKHSDVECSSSDFVSESLDSDNDEEDLSLLTVDELSDSASGVDLNCNRDPDLTVSDIMLDDVLRDVTYCKLPRDIYPTCHHQTCCCPHLNDNCHRYLQNDWYSIISNEINNYVMYCRSAGYHW